MYAEYFLDATGMERRKRKKITLGLVRNPDGSEKTKREALRLLQPYINSANARIAAPVREIKAITLNPFLEIWKRDYLAGYKPSTRAAMNSHVTRIEKFFGDQDMRAIEAADFQRFVSALRAADLTPKSIRNFWITTRLIWDKARKHKFIELIPEKPTLPRLYLKRAPLFTLADVGQILFSLKAQSVSFIV
jgi:Phage integrase, N-terminal SAM-like domain